MRTILDASFERYPSHLEVVFRWEGETRTFSRERIYPKPAIGCEEEEIRDFFAQTFARSHDATLGTISAL